MIEVSDLRKTYGDLVAVDGISFSAQPGRIFGLLGPNGAGKSTTIGCISGLLKPSGGQVRVQGFDVVVSGVESRRQLGIVPQELALYGDLSATENLNFWGAAYGLRGSRLKEQVTDVLKLTGLLDRASEPTKRFSGGMKRRLNFAVGVVHQPKVLLLDEPTVGVDPQSRVRLLDLVREQAEDGTTVLYTTHYMEEAETLCDQLAIVDHGKIIATGTLKELRGMLGENDILRLTGRFDPNRSAQALGGVEGVEVVQSTETDLRLSAPDAIHRLPEILGVLTSVGCEIHDTTLTRPSLESLFIKLTGKELRE